MAEDSKESSAHPPSPSPQSHPKGTDECAAHPISPSAPLRDGDVSIDGIDIYTNRIDRRARGLTKIKNRPKQLICHLCGNDFGTASLAIHVKVCRRKRIVDQSKLPVAWRRDEPPGPNPDLFPLPGSQKASRSVFDTYNIEAWRIYCSGVSCTCKSCGCPLTSPEHQELHESQCAGKTNDERPVWLPHCLPTPREQVEGGDDVNDMIDRNDDCSRVRTKLDEAVLHDASICNETIENDPWATAVWATYHKHSGSDANLLRQLHLATFDDRENQDNIRRLSEVLGTPIKSLRNELVDYWYQVHDKLLQRPRNSASVFHVGDVNTYNSNCRDDAHPRQHTEEMSLRDDGDCYCAVESERKKPENLGHVPAEQDQERFELMKRLAETEQQLQQSAERLAVATEERDQARSWVNLKQNELANVQEECRKLMKHLDETRHVLAKSQEDCELAKADLVSAQRDLDEARTRDVAEQEALAKVNDDLKQATVDLDAARRELANCTASAAAMQEAARDEEKELQSALTEARNDALRSAAELKVAASSAAATKETAAREKLELEDALVKARDDAQRSAAELQAATSAATAMNSAAARKITELEEALAKARENEERKAAELHALGSSADAMNDAAAREKADLKDALSKARNEAHRTASELHAVTEVVAREKAELMDSLTKSRDEAQLTSSELANTQKELAHASSSAAAAVSSLEEALSNCRTEVDRLASELQEKQKALDEANSALIKQRDTDSRENAKLKAMFANACAETERCASDAEQYRQQLEQAQAALANASKAEASKHSEFQAALSSARAHALQTSEELERSLADANSEKARLKCALQEKQNEVDKLTLSKADELEKLRGEMDAQANALEQVKHTLASREVDVASANAARASIEAQTAGLRDALGGAEEAQARAKRERAEMEEELITLRDASKRADVAHQATHARLSDDLAGKERECKEALKSAEQARLKVADLEDQLKQRREALAAEEALSAENATRLRDELARIRDERDGAAAASSEAANLATTQVRAAEQRRDAAESELEAARKLNRDLDAELKCLHDKHISERETAKRELTAAREAIAQAAESQVAQTARDDRATQTDVSEDGETNGHLRWGSADPRWRYLRKGEGTGLTAGRRAIVEQVRAAELARVEKASTHGEAPPSLVSETDNPGVAVAAPLQPRVATSPSCHYEVGPALPVLLPADPKDGASRRLERQARRSANLPSSVSAPSRSGRAVPGPSGAPSARPKSAVAPPSTAGRGQ